MSKPTGYPVSNVDLWFALDDALELEKKARGALDEAVSRTVRCRYQIREAQYAAGRTAAHDAAERA